MLRAGTPVGGGGRAVARNPNATVTFASGNGDAGAGEMQIVAGGTLRLTGTINALGGAAGTPSGPAADGGGGGGVVVLASRGALTVSGTIAAAGGGNGGGGRVIAFVSPSVTTTGSTLDVASGGSGSGVGGASGCGGSQVGFTQTIATDPADFFY